MKFRKRPVCVEAEQLLWSNWSGVCELLFHGDVHPGGGRARGLDPKEAAELFPNAGIDPDPGDAPIYALVPTREGDMLASEGDWIIRGVHGELYPIKEGIFLQTYEAVEDDVAAPVGQSESDGN